mmetsp:Transcript_10677/g.19728  ORF Transcript_10677/g.19728 Transcript_10677/m.19728 type:complete len:82 (+) Transcript_10677:2861-3106(+)
MPSSPAINHRTGSPDKFTFFDKKNRLSVGSPSQVLLGNVGDRATGSPKKFTFFHIQNHRSILSPSQFLLGKLIDCETSPLE